VSFAGKSVGLRLIPTVRDCVSLEKCRSKCLMSSSKSP
jgi:hypothetical protein